MTNFRFALIFTFRIPNNHDLKLNIIMRNKITAEEQLILISEKRNDIINPNKINNTIHFGMSHLQDLIKKISKENYTDSLLEIINEERLKKKIYQDTHHYFGNSHKNRSKSTLPKLVTTYNSFDYK